MKKKKIKYGVANDGQEAVNKWKAGEYHLILVRCLLTPKGLVAKKVLDGYTNANHGWD